MKRHCALNQQKKSKKELRSFIICCVFLYGSVVLAFYYDNIGSVCILCIYVSVV